jgi:O-antigen/teichoic acid export membrane protein
VSLSLVTARWLLEGLGFADFGLLSVLGATVMMSNSITGALSRSASRQMAFELGRGDMVALRRAFNTSLIIFVVLAVLSFLVGEAIMPLLFRFLTIPDDRLTAARWAYQFTLIQWCVIMLTTPLFAALHASQASILLSCNEVVGRLNVLIAAGLVIYLPGDRLINYTFMMAALTVLGVVGPVFGCWRYCPACRPGADQFDRQEFRRIGQFAGWSILQNLGVHFCNQGGVVILNAFFDTVVDGAYALAQRGVTCQTLFAGAIVNPIAPAMIGYQARQQQKQVEVLVHATSKYLALINLMIWVPFVLESEEVFGLWLGDYPPQAPLFARLLMTTSLISALSMGFSVALEGRGQIAAVALIWNLPLLIVTGVMAGWFALSPSSPQLLPLMMLLTTAIICLVVCPFFVGPALGIGAGKWLQQVARPCLIVMACMCAAAAATRLILPEGLMRVIAVTAASTVTAGIAIWFLALADWERQHFARVGRAATGRSPLVPVSTPSTKAELAPAPSHDPDDEITRQRAPQS